MAALAQGIPVIDKWAAEPIQEDSEPRALSRVLQKMGAGRTNVVLAFNPAHLATRYFEIPLIPLEEQKNAISYEASRFIPFKTEEAVSDFRLKPKQNREGKRLLSIAYTAAKREVIHRYLQSARQAKVQLAVLEPVFASVSRALSLTEEKLEESTYGLIFIDTENVNLTLIHDGMVYLSHDFLLTEDRPASETRFYQELKSSLEYLFRIWGIQGVKRFFLAGAGPLQVWKDFLAGAFKNEINFELGAFPPAKNRPPEEAGKFLAAAGLALRSLKFSSPLGDLSLIPPEARRTDPRQIKKLILQEFLLIVLSSVLLRIAVLEPYALYLEKRGPGAVDLEVLGEPDFSAGSVADLEQAAAQLKTQLDLLRQASKGKSLLSRKLEALARLKPPSIWVEGLNYGAEAGGKRKFSFQGHCYLGDPEKEVEGVNDWAKALNDDKKFMESFQKLTVTEMRRGKFEDQDTTTFQITAE